LTDARQAFGLTLRAHREHLGITLPDIAESTKISVALLSGLERGDISRWPKGIYRRAFFREYAIAIGRSPEPLLNDFARLFPEESGVPAAAEKPVELRLELAVSDTPGSVTLKRAAIVAGELAAVSLIGTIVTGVMAIATVPAIGLTALVYYPLANLVVDRKLATRSLRGLLRQPSTATRPEPRRYEDIEGHEELQVSF
jgi:transcriptional regulator with XRE-family HTH domain